MNEISHTQAQYLIRQSADKRLPEAQWSALQAHLERCPACRGYRDRLAGLDRAARRVLLARWRPAEMPAPLKARALLELRRKRQENRRTALYGVLGLAAAFLIVLLSLPNWAPALRGPAAGQAARQAAAEPTATNAALPTPTAPPDYAFQGLVAYASRASGDGEIYLINAGPNGPEQVNLTNHPAEDSAPAWSPDGEWLAFLSDRSGKDEIYVVNVAGTGLVQLTSAPHLRWHGPLSWSSDGRTIALTADRLNQGGDAYTYLVSIDGAPPVSLPGTRGIAMRSQDGSPSLLTPPLFSPSLPLLVTTGPDRMLLGASTAAGWSALALSLDALTLNRAEPAVYPYDWGLGGDGLLYVDAASGDIRSLYFMDPERPTELGLAAPLVQASEEGGPFRSVTHQPSGALLATLKDDTNSGCWNVHVFYLYLYNLPPERAYPELCVLADLQGANWAMGVPSERLDWLILAGQPAADGPADSGAAGIYALHVPGRAGDEPPGPYEKLADLPPGEAPIPQARPRQPALGLQPRAAEGIEPAQPQPARVPAGLPGRLLLLDEDGAVFTRAPNSEQRAELLPPGAVVTCPKWSPDRSKLVFLSDRGSPPARAADGSARRGPSEIFVLDVASGEANQLTDAMLSGRAAMGLLQGYTCPVWSPDGKYLAVNSYLGRGSGLMVMTAEGSIVRYMPTDHPTTFADLAWSPDGRSVLMAQPALRGSSPQIVEALWRNQSATRLLLSFDGWDDIQALSLAPDGRRLALILYRQPVNNRPAEAALRVVTLPERQIHHEVPLPGYDPRLLRGPARIQWLDERYFVLAVPQSPLSSAKGLLMRYDLLNRSMDTLLVSDDALYDWAVQDDWLITSSESGLWILPPGGEPSAAQRLSPEPAVRLEWLKDP